jgi:predicted dehydrogenase
MHAGWREEGSLAASRQVRLRVGVIGLGRLWEARHKPALMRLGDRFRVAAVYDQVARRAEIEANAIGCHAAAGIHALIERSDVDVIYLLSPQWFGMHALEPAVESGKPVYCALPLAAEPALIERLDGRLRDGKSFFMPEFARRHYPATIRLRELLATRLGPPRLIVGQVRLSGFDRYGQPGPSTQIAPAPLLLDPGSYVLDWTRYVFQSEPMSLQGSGNVMIPGPTAGEHDVEALAIEFPGGGLAQWTIARYHRGAWGEAARFLPTPGIQVFAERGAAWLEMPDRIVWTDSEGQHEERLSLEPTIGETLNAHFHRAIRGQQPFAPAWPDAVTAARLVLRLNGWTPVEPREPVR